MVVVVVVVCPWPGMHSKILFESQKQVKSKNARGLTMVPVIVHHTIGTCNAGRPSRPVNPLKTSCQLAPAF